MQTAGEAGQRGSGVRRTPDTLLILLGVALVMAALTWVVPRGHFAGVGGGLIELDSFRLDGIRGVGAFASGGDGFLNILFEGLAAGGRMGATVGIAAFLLIVGGAFGVINATGAVDRGVMAVTGRLAHNPVVLLPVLFGLFSLGGAVFGMGEEAIAFAAILVPLLNRLGFDPITGVLATYGATQVGFATSWMNPFSVAIAQGIAEVPLLSGMGLRMIMWAVFTAAGAFFLVRHGNAVRRRSGGPEPGGDDDEPTGAEAFNGRDAAVLGLLALCVAWIVFGVTARQYYIPEIAAQFFALAAAVGLAACCWPGRRMHPNRVAEAFVDGARGLLPAVLIVALAKGIVLLLGGSDPSEPSVLNTLLYGMASVVGDLPEALSAILMLVFQSVVNFFVTSGSGQAALTMPVMAPLGDLVGVSRQVAVLAFQLGDGLTNLIVPTSAALMGTLGVARVDWLDWVRTILLFQAVLYLLAVGFVIAAVGIGY